MPSDVHYIAYASLSEWSGNHQREITEWVFGAWEEFNGPNPFYQDRPHAEAMAWAHDPEGYEGTLEQFPHEEYGMVWSDVDNWTYGENSIWWRLTEAPTDEQWGAFRAALESFEVEPRSYVPDPPKVEINKVGLVRIEIKRTHVR